jgi:hypothetical protein
MQKKWQNEQKLKKYDFKRGIKGDFSYLCKKIMSSQI